MQETTENMKICNQCNIEKSINEYYKRTDGTYNASCKICTCNNQRKNRYERILRGPSAFSERRKKQKLLRKDGKHECYTCKEVKDLSEFYYQPKRNRYVSYCKTCHNMHGRAWLERVYYPSILPEDNSIISPITLRTPADKQNKVFDLYKNTPLSTYKIAKTTGLGTSTIQIWKKQRIFDSMVHPDISAPIKSRFSAEKKERIFELYRTTPLKFSDIAREVGVCASTLNLWKKKGIFDGIARINEYKELLTDTDIVLDNTKLIH
jgi:transcription elongation factor Elf1